MSTLRSDRPDMTKIERVAPLRILFHHRIRSKDGQFVHLEELVKSFRRLGHEVLVVGPRVLETASFGTDAGYVEKLRAMLPRGLFELLEFAYSIPAFFRVLYAITRFRPDFVYERFNLFFPAGALAARVCRVPLALEVNAPLHEERSSQAGITLAAISRWSQGFVWRSADLGLPVSAVLARTMEGYGVDPASTLVLHNGVDPEHFHPVDGEAAKAALGLNGRLVLGFVGFVRTWNRVDLVIRLLATDRLPPRAHLVVVGDGPARPGLETLARELGVSERVTFTGLVGRERVPSLVGAFDIALQPAVTEYASPLKAIEYLAMGKPIVGPAQENLCELLTHDVNAWLFPPSDPHGVAGALATLAADDDLRRRLGRGAEATIRRLRLTWDDNAARICERMAKLTRQGDRPRKDSVPS